MKLIELMALSSSVALALTDKGWRLTDGYHFSPVYGGWEEAMADEEAKGAFRYGQDLLRKEWRYV